MYTNLYMAASGIGASLSPKVAASRGQGGRRIVVGQLFVGVRRRQRRGNTGQRRRRRHEARTGVELAAGGGRRVAVGGLREDGEGTRRKLRRGVVIQEGNLQGEQGVTASSPPLTAAAACIRPE